MLFPAGGPLFILGVWGGKWHLTASLFLDKFPNMLQNLYKKSTFLFVPNCHFNGASLQAAVFKCGDPAITRLPWPSAESADF